MYVKKVREFSKACEGALPETPEKISEEKVEFICRMVNDELDELKEAKDISEQADALVDAIYYICDTAVRHGMNLDNVFEIVHRSNMTKVVDGKVLKRASDGKVLKPKEFVDPKKGILREMKRQCKEGSF